MRNWKLTACNRYISSSSLISLTVFKSYPVPFKPVSVVKVQLARQLMSSAFGEQRQLSREQSIALPFPLGKQNTGATANEVSIAKKSPRIQHLPPRQTR